MVQAAEPDRQPPLHVADHYPVGVTLTDLYLVYPDDCGPQLASGRELIAHVGLVHLLDRVSVEAEVADHRSDRRTPARLVDVEGEASGVVRIGSEPVYQHISPKSLNYLERGATEPHPP